MEAITEGNGYPKIVLTPEGYRADMSRNTSIPGYFTDYLRAERAIAQYKSRSNAKKFKKNKKD